MPVGTDRVAHSGAKLEPDCFAIGTAERRAVTIAKWVPINFTVPFAERRTEHRT